MNARQGIAALGFAAASLAVGTTLPATATQPTSSPAVSMLEQDCRETTVPRAVLTSGLDPLVPDRYRLVELTPTASRLTVTTYTCARVSVDGRRVVGRDRPTTVTIGSATVTHRDGEALPSQQQYLLWYGTDNPVQFAKLRQTGLPVVLLPQSDATATTDAGTTTIDWHIRGSGMDYDQQAIATEPVTDPARRVTTWWYDGPKGDLNITYDNLLATSTAVITADFTGNDVLSEIIALPTLLQVNGVPFPFLRGSWTAQVSFVD